MLAQGLYLFGPNIDGPLHAPYKTSTNLSLCKTIFWSVPNYLARYICMSA